MYTDSNTLVTAPFCLRMRPRPRNRLREAGVSLDVYANLSARELQECDIHCRLHHYILGYSNHTLQHISVYTDSEGMAWSFDTWPLWEPEGEFHWKRYESAQELSEYFANMLIVSWQLSPLRSCP
jgi:hypothetical protein